MKKKILKYKSEDFITDKMRTKMSVAQSNYIQFLQRMQNTTDPEQFEQLKGDAQKHLAIYEEQSNLAITLYVENVGKDTKRLKEDTLFMLKQLDYETIIALYSTHVAFSFIDIAAGAEREAERRLYGYFEGKIDADQITEESVINNIEASCIERYLTEQYEVIRRNYEGAEREELRENIVGFSIDYIRDLLLENGGLLALIEAIKDNVLLIEAEDKTKTPIEENISVLDALPSNYQYVPATMLARLIHTSVAQAGRTKEYIDRKNEVIRHERYKLKEKGDPIISKKGDNEYIVIYTSSSGTMQIALPEIMKGLYQGKKPAAKLLMFYLSKIRAQAYSYAEKRIVYDFIDFNLNELVEKGIYSDIHSARRGFISITKMFLDIKVFGEADAEGAVLFPAYKVPKNNICTVNISNAVDWYSLFKYETLLPDYSYGLSSKAYFLIYYISCMARQNTKSIKEEGSFTIPFRTVQTELMLPDERATKDPSGKIKKPILNIIEEINKADKDTAFTLEACVRGTPANTTEFLDNGFIKVIVSGEILEHLEGIQSRKTKAIEDATKRKERNKDKGQVQAYKQIELNKQNTGKSEEQ